MPGIAQYLTICVRSVRPFSREWKTRVQQKLLDTKQAFVDDITLRVFIKWKGRIGMVPLTVTAVRVVTTRDTDTVIPDS